MIKNRTGKECKKIKCAFYLSYSNWIKSLGNPALMTCMECKHAHVSQYQAEKEQANDN